MDWIRVDTGLPTHPKSFDLGEILGEERAWARMVCLWAWAKSNALDGRIGGRNPTRVVETAAGWTGRPGAFVDAAVQAGFLNRDGADLVLHDWGEHNGKALKRAEESADRARQWREQREAERLRERQEQLEANAKRPQPERVREPASNAYRTHSQTHSERVPNAERDETDVTDVTDEPTKRSKKGSEPPDGGSSPREPLVLQAEEAKSPRKLSDQESFFAFFQSERSKRFPEALPDRHPEAKVINSLVKEPLRQAGELALRRGALAYLDSDFARHECSPPGAFAPFIANYARHVPVARAAAPPVRDPYGRNGAVVDDQDPAAHEPRGVMQ